MGKVVLFDLDGTLLDTSRGVIKSIEYTVEKLGYEKLTEQELRSFIGPPIYNSLKNRYNLTDIQATDATEIFRDSYKNLYLFEADVYENLYEVLEWISKTEIKIGVATYKREDYAISLLNHFGIAKYCDVIHGADFENKLTKSDIINLCLCELNAKNPKEVVMVGDTEHDAKAAKARGIEFVGVTFGFGFHNKKDVEQYPHKAVIDNMIELKRILQSNI